MLALGEKLGTRIALSKFMKERPRMRGLENYRLVAMLIVTFFALSSEAGQKIVDGGGGGGQEIPVMRPTQSFWMQLLNIQGDVIAFGSGFRLSNGIAPSMTDSRMSITQPIADAVRSHAPGIAELQHYIEYFFPISQLSLDARRMRLRVKVHSLDNVLLVEGEGDQPRIVLDVPEPPAKVIVSCSPTAFTPNCVIDVLHSASGPNSTFLQDGMSRRSLLTVTVRIQDTSLAIPRWYELQSDQTRLSTGVAGIN